MFLLGKEEFLKKRDAKSKRRKTLRQYQGARLGRSTDPANTTTFIPAVPREELNLGGMPNIVSGYSSIGIDLNPFDIAYRADTLEEYYVDLGTLFAKAAWSYGTAGAGPAAATIFREVWGLIS